MCTDLKIYSPLNHGVNRISDFHHGTQVIQFNGGTRVTSTISIEIVSMVFTFSFAETLLAFISYVCK
ncbi:hypothetical protein FPM93_15350 [Salmonella enterica]|uniref:Uncharacterized protein n=1 Tax=Salmonella enterica TaxID=28901 RepID=A0A5Y5IQ80_SALER|nr:hypothetical protein [Salmonella enterica]ECL1477844.1 hypothetical protein [Salmonella enterica]